MIVSLGEEKGQGSTLLWLVCLNVVCLQCHRWTVVAREPGLLQRLMGSGRGVSHHNNKGSLRGDHTEIHHLQSIDLEGEEDLLPLPSSKNGRQRGRLAMAGPLFPQMNLFLDSLQVWRTAGVGREFIIVWSGL